VTIKQMIYNSVVPSIISAIASVLAVIITILIQQQLQKNESISKSLDLYNTLSPNSKIEIGAGSIELYYNFNTSLDSYSNGIKSLAKTKDNIEGLSVDKKLGKLDEYVHSFNADISDKILLRSVNYCVENLGASEVSIYLPSMQFISNVVKNEFSEPLELHGSIAIGVVGPKSKSCSKITFKIDEGQYENNIPYKFSVKVEPSEKVLKFIYPDLEDYQIRNKAEVLSVIYNVYGNL
jgi:hypothetical protein